MPDNETYSTSKEAKQAGWFSRRHRTSDEHMAAKEHYENKENINKAPKQ